jgi:hypothetical protein
MKNYVFWRNLSCNPFGGKVRYGQRRSAEELDGPAVGALPRAITKVKQRWSVIGWVGKNLLFRAPPCFGRHVQPVVPVAFAFVSTHFSFKEG